MAISSPISLKVDISFISNTSEDKSYVSEIYNVMIIFVRYIVTELTFRKPFQLCNTMEVSEHKEGMCS